MKGWFLYSAWIVALLGTCLSLYFGEVLQIPPCELCWYQRIALFPLALLLGIATYRSDEQIYLYALPLSIAGFFIALYQAMTIHFPVMQEWLSCGKECSEEIFLLFDMVTLPDLSAIGFALITLFLAQLRKSSPPQKKNH